MNEVSIIDQGTTLMLYGMGTVFVFLTLLVFATLLMSKMVQRFAAPEEEPSNPKTSASSNSAPVDANIVTAIQKALAAHRNR
jgi:oxaloacetate decarboxylase gamma subunit